MQLVEIGHARMKYSIVLLCWLLIFILPSHGLAEEDVDQSETNYTDVLNGFESQNQSAGAGGKKGSPENDVLQGFDSLADQNPDGHDVETSDKVVSLGGYGQLRTVFNVSHDEPKAQQTDWRGLSRLRTTLQLDLQIDPAAKWQAKIGGRGFYDFAYLIRGQNDFTNTVVDEYESELELQEAFVLGTLTRDLDVKIGRQIVSWGTSENVRVTDILNPVDLRDPGLTDIEDLKLPVTMTRLDYYLGNFSFSGMAIHEIRFNKNPVYGYDFYPYSQPLPSADEPASNLENTEFGAAVNGIFSGWDISLYVADVYDDQPRFRSIAAPAPAFVLTHDRVQMIGAASNIAVKDWLLKSEAAYFHGFEFAQAPGKDFDRTDFLLGFEYYGFDETTICTEFVNRHYLDFDTILEGPPDNAQEDLFQYSFRVTRTFWHERLTLTALALIYGVDAEDGALERFTCEYDVTDTVSLLLGFVLYQSGDLPVMNDIGENDRVFFETTYSF